MTAVPYCLCRHARQVHQATDGTLCRGRCEGYKHRPESHTGACSARCDCDRYVGAER